MEHEAPGIVHSYVCPLVQSLPYQLRAAFVDKEQAADLPLLAPIFHFERGRRHVSAKLRELARRFDSSGARADKAIREAWAALDRFRDTCRRRGEEVLDRLAEDEIALVIISRSYNGCDPGTNLAIPDKLRDLGVLAIPLDFLPLDLRTVQDEFPHMYWKYGQSILAAARHIAQHPNLHAVYVTNFRCGPDSFISKFFDRVLGKPYLTLEIDEHSADVGVITRCEAFLDSIRSAGRRRLHKRARGEDLFFDIRKRSGNLKVYIPHMDDHGLMMQSVLRANGVSAEALPVSDTESMLIGRRFTTGKECFPCILTTGDIVKKTQCKDFDRRCAGFFMPQASGPCRFGQYHKFHRMVLDEIGLEDVPMVVLDQTRQFSRQVKSFGPRFYSTCWELLVIVDSMQKMVRETRSCEVNRGETDRVYRQCLRELAEVAERKGDHMSKAAEIRRRLEQIPADRSDPRPLIGVIGEIYVRSNEFANNFLARRLEGLGAEVALPPLQEWINYIAAGRREIAVQNRQPLALAKEWLLELGMRWIEWRTSRFFRGAIRHMPRESRISQVLRLGSLYLHPTIKGEAVLSVGRAVEYAHGGFDGVVNVAPFGCMPGAIVNSLLERFRQDYGVPVLKLEFDGQEQPSEQTALEAFVHQAREHMLSRLGQARTIRGPALEHPACASPRT
jgi:predicted nucleotide-binding protein (sugar kinase/HSP70/actin superfamily)